MAKGKIELWCTSDGEVAYVSLPDHPGHGTAGCTARQVRVSHCVKDYSGPDLYLDFDDNNILIGMEILID